MFPDFRVSRGSGVTEGLQGHKEKKRIKYKTTESLILAQDER